jgi:hypothetical protein
MGYERFSPLLLTIPLACCAPVGPAPPSLLPRAAEAIDPRLPVLPSTAQRPVDAALAVRLAALVQQARTGDSAFQSAATQAERLMATAGAPRSESWISAQEALSAASAARSGTTRALADVDAIGATTLQATGTLAPADQAAIESAARQIGEIDQAQAARLAAIMRRLGI